MDRTAILIDGAFFLRRYPRSFGQYGPGARSAREVVSDLCWMARAHLKGRDEERKLYRIFVYDSPPLGKKAHNPVSKQAVDFSRLPSSVFRRQWHDELVKRRKVALRLGTLAEGRGRWIIRPKQTKRLLSGALSLDELNERDVTYDVTQKGVDMRIGLDIASLAFKRQVEQIVLVAGDSDFVPAAKLARREGIDFVLDPMWHPIHQDLHVHIDGLRSVCKRPDADS